MRNNEDLLRQRRCSWRSYFRGRYLARGPFNVLTAGARTLNNYLSITAAYNVDDIHVSISCSQPLLRLPVPSVPSIGKTLNYI